MRRYRLKADRFEHKAGTICYPCVKPTYGLCSDDERYTGVAHRAMTLKSDGDYPFFTVPATDLEEF